MCFNYHLCYVKHILDPIHVLFTLFGCLDVGKGLGHNLLMHSQQLKKNMEIFKTDFFGVLTIHNDQISYVKECLDPLYVIFTVFELPMR